MYVYTDISHIRDKETFFILETTRSEVDDFDLTFQWMNEEDVFWFQIAMDDTLLP